MSTLPPPLSESKRSRQKQNRNRIVVALLFVVAIPTVVCVSALVSLQLTGMIRPFHVPTGAMSPAIQPGDDIYMEALTYRWSKPQRGDIVVTRTDGIAGGGGGAIWAKRLVGLPRDRVSILDGAVYVNGARLPLRNNTGEIHYVNASAGSYLTSGQEMVKVPDDRYFVLGDNSANSYDSRYWGFLPADAVLGRAVFCYWPPHHFGFLR